MTYPEVPFALDTLGPSSRRSLYLPFDLTSFNLFFYEYRCTTFKCMQQQEQCVIKAEDQKAGVCLGYYRETNEEYSF